MRHLHTHLGLEARLGLEHGRERLGGRADGQAVVDDLPKDHVGVLARDALVNGGRGHVAQGPAECAALRHARLGLDDEGLGAVARVGHAVGVVQERRDEGHYEGELPRRLCEGLTLCAVVVVRAVAHEEDQAVIARQRDVGLDARGKHAVGHRVPELVGVGGLGDVELVAEGERARREVDQRLGDANGTHLGAVIRVLHERDALEVVQQ